MRCTYLHLRVQVLHNFVEAADRAHNALHQLPLLLFVWICARQRQMVQCVSESCAQEAAASQRSIHGRAGWHSLSGAWSMLPSSKCEQPPHSASWSGLAPPTGIAYAERWVIYLLIFGRGRVALARSHCFACSHGKLSFCARAPNGQKINERVRSRDFRSPSSCALATGTAQRLAMRLGRGSGRCGGSAQAIPATSTHR